MHAIGLKQYTDTVATGMVAMSMDLPRVYGRFFRSSLGTAAGTTLVTRAFWIGTALGTTLYFTFAFSTPQSFA